MKFFIVVFDRAPAGRYKQFHEEFVQHPAIRNWWHYVKSCYIVGGQLTSSELSKHYRAVAKKYGIPENHLVMRVDLRSRQGWLPPKAWEWVQRAAPEQDPPGAV